MSAPQKHVLRNFVKRETALKLILNERPKSVEELRHFAGEVRVKTG